MLIVDARTAIGGVMNVSSTGSTARHPMMCCWRPRCGISARCAPVRRLRSGSARRVGGTSGRSSPGDLGGCARPLRAHARAHRHLRRDRGRPQLVDRLARRSAAAAATQITGPRCRMPLRPRQPDGRCRYAVVRAVSQLTARSARGSSGTASSAVLDRSPHGWRPDLVQPADRVEEVPRLKAIDSSLGLPTRHARTPG